MRFIKFNPEKIEEIKKALKGNNIREAGRVCGVSYYTAWCVKEGKYDEERLQMFETNLCPITGFKYGRNY